MILWQEGFFFPTSIIQSAWNNFNFSSSFQSWRKLYDHNDSNMFPWKEKLRCKLYSFLKAGVKFHWTIKQKSELVVKSFALQHDVWCKSCKYVCHEELEFCSPFASRPLCEHYVWCSSQNHFVSWECCVKPLFSMKHARVKEEDFKIQTAECQIYFLAFFNSGLHLFHSWFNGKMIVHFRIKSHCVCGTQSLCRLEPSFVQITFVGSFNTHLATPQQGQKWMTSWSWPNHVLYISRPSATSFLFLFWWLLSLFSTFWSLAS